MLLLKFLQKRKLAKAVKKADKLAELYRQKFFVLRYKRGFIVKSRRELRKLIREGYFVKGFDLNEVRKIAIYTTAHKEQ
jgi:hypothetical protein